MRCKMGFPSGRCAAECHASNSAPTCEADGKCVCLSLVQPPSLGPSLALAALEVEDNADPSVRAIHDWAMTGILVYLSLVCVILYTRRRNYRKNVSVY